jgi:hypothetical protein
MLRAPEAQRPLDRPHPEQTPALKLGPMTEMSRLHRFAAMPTATIAMANTTVSTVASNSNHSNAISSINRRTMEENAGRAHQTPLLVKNTADVDLYALVPGQGT